MTTTLEPGSHHLDGDIDYPAPSVGDDLDAARGWAGWVGDALLAWSKNPATDGEKQPTDDQPNFVSQAFVKLGIGLAEVYTHIADVEVRRAEHGAKNAWRSDTGRQRDTDTAQAATLLDGAASNLTDRIDELDAVVAELRATKPMQFQVDVAEAVIEQAEATG